ncbi:uncharacterized protein LOC141614681 [Silene latifolia]|uniref:uncharacterized protein LOC141614681 n=1 Tax=Silene latifolia TaxID=37657 RepID=UPI003D7855D4
MVNLTISESPPHNNEIFNNIIFENSSSSFTTPFTMDPTDPLYLHPAESTHPVMVDTKLSCIENYLEWKRQMEIAICSKRKLGFLTGVIKRPTNDAFRESAWDTCNCLLIAWIMHNVELPIKRSLMYTKTTKGIWDYLQDQFSVRNGVRKFRLNKELDELSQGEKTVNEYFTELRILWQNLEIMSDWPPITQVTLEVNAWLDPQLKEQEERKLFQFLNGLNTSYATIRSHVLMMSPLPTGEEAVVIFQREEARRKNYICGEKCEAETTAFYAGQSQKEPDAPSDQLPPAPTCPLCKMKGHTRDKCWKVIGYPSDTTK